MGDAKQPTIVLTGGGTGGHITPILAVAHEIKLLNPASRVVYVGEKGGKFGELTNNNPDIDEVYTVRAGKLRRYHGESIIKRLTDVKTNALNARDALFVSVGVPQASRLLTKLKPDVVFLKGGFVGVPIGLAAAKKRIPIVTHDSDALPGLANRVVSRWAAVHATALPAKYYPYTPDKVVPVGVLLEAVYRLVDDQQQRKYKQQLGLSVDKPLLLITGGSSGAVRINKAVVKIIDALLQNQPTLQVIHQVGKGKGEVYGDYQHERLTVLEFMSPMAPYIGAADLIVTRAGATHLAEFGAMGKACLVIPNQELTGGHQLKNAERLEEQGSAQILREDMMYDSTQGLLPVIENLLADEKKRKQLAATLHQTTILGAAKRIAVLLLEQVKR